MKKILALVIGFSLGFSGAVFAAQSIFSVQQGGTGIGTAPAGYPLIGFTSGSSGALQATSTIFVSPIGNFGVGTTTPGANIAIFTNLAKYLSVTGPTTGEAGVIELGATSTTNGAAVGGIQFYNYANSDATTFSSNSTLLSAITSFIVNDGSPTGPSFPTQNGGGLAFFTKPYTGTIAPASPAMTISHTGEVGIGMGADLPTNKLTVSGSGSFGASFDQTTAPTNGLLVEGLTAIGTSTPYAKLSIWGGSEKFLEIVNGASTTIFSVDGSGVTNTTALTVTNNATFNTGLTGPAHLTSGLLSAGAIALGSEISGTLPIANGGTNATSQSSGGINFFNGTSITSGTNLILSGGGSVGLGTTTPFGKMNIAGSGGGVLTLTDNTASANTKHWQILSAVGGFAIRTQNDAGNSPSAKVVITSGGLVGIATSTPAYTLDIFGDMRVDPAYRLITPYQAAPTLDTNGQIAIDSTSDQVKFQSSGATKVLGNGNFYPSFTYSTTTWTGTTTIPIGTAYIAETWNGAQCFTDVGTLNVVFNDATNNMDLFNASTTVGTVTLSTNNTFTASEKRYVSIGTPASSPTKVSCTISKSYTAD